MSSLPEELYLDLLLMVPDVKSLLVCKSVCKKWYALISDSDFVKMHLDRNEYSLLVKNNIGYKLYLSYDSSTESDHVVELEAPYKYLRYPSTKLLGSCNGLVYGWNRYMQLFFLWNPATKEYKRLPNRSISFLYKYESCHGFGYDYKTDDYKLVITQRNDYSRQVGCQVYSLKSNTWRNFQSILRYVFPYSQVSGVLYHGALHWVGNRIGKCSSRIIVTMDLSEETFQEFHPPNQCYIKNIGVLEDCLCVLAHTGLNFEVWVMQDYGVPDSWNKLYTITYESIMCGFSSYVMLIGSFKNGEILFMAESKIISYDSKYGTARKTKIDNIHEEGATKYSESLISLNTNSVVGRMKQRESTTKKRNRCPSIEEALVGNLMG